MQLGGVGHSHSTENHQVTNCLHHDHDLTKKEGAGAKLSSVKASMQAQQAQGQEFTLSSLMQNLFGSSRRILRGIWGTNEAAVTGSAEKGSDRERVPAQSGERVSPGSRRAEAQTETAQVNPYFSIVSDNNAAVWSSPVQKMKARVKSAAGQLAGRLPGQFLKSRAKGSFQAKQERPKEDLRKHSRYRKDELEIDCILTDESYLLDSYDRKGEYSRLSVSSNRAVGSKDSVSAGSTIGNTEGDST